MSCPVRPAGCDAGPRHGCSLPQALVIGGSRFVGLALVKRLLEAAYRVTVLNRGSRNDALPDGVEVVVCDRKDPAALKEKLSSRRFDAVFDIIAYVPEDTNGLLAAIDRSSLRHYVHISTGSVYRPAQRLPLCEDFPRGPEGAADEYGRNKYLIEEILLRAYREEGLPVTLFRPGYIYGPNNYVYREAFYFDRLLAGRPLLVPGDGSIITQFGYVDDLAAMMLCVLGNERAIGEAYNFAGEFAVTTDEYLRTVIDAVGERFGAERDRGRGCGGDGPGPNPAAGDGSPRLVHFRPAELGLAPADIRRVFPYKWREHTLRSTEKARVQLGYRESVSLSEGLNRSFSWYTSGGRERYGFRPDYRVEDQILARLGAGA